MAFIKQTFVDGVTVVQAAWLNGIQEVVGASAVAPEYSSEQTYAVETLVSHDAQLYICTTTIASPEEWNSSHWMATSLQALLSEQRGVYWCLYGVSTYAQVDNAKSKSMLPICTYDFTVDNIRYRGTAVYAYISSGSYVFLDYCETGTFVKLYIDSESTWTRELLNPLDSQMSDSSERAVQNKVIKAYVDSVVAYGMNIVDVSGTTPTIDAQAETRYVCGEVTSLAISSLPRRGIADIMFTSGSTPTVLTLPNTVIMPAWFDATSLDANTTYEINIMDGVYGTVMQWA